MIQSNLNKLIVTQCKTCSYATAHVGKVQYMAAQIPYCKFCLESIEEARELLSALLDEEEDQEPLL